MIYVISDCHFGHMQILKYCKRPFKDVEEMDAELIRRWNEVVLPSDTIYHIGDFKMGATPDTFQPVGSRSITEKAFIDSIVKQLNGNKIWLKGDHREPPNTVDNAKLQYEGYNFVMVHEPEKAFDAGFVPSACNWLLHGHKHNHELQDFPFFNRRKHRFNVSAELINYRPVPLATLVDIINGHELRMGCL